MKIAITIIILTILIIIVKLVIAILIIILTVIMKTGIVLKLMKTVVQSHNPKTHICSNYDNAQQEV